MRAVASVVVMPVMLVMLVMLVMKVTGIPASPASAKLVKAYEASNGQSQNHGLKALAKSFESAALKHDGDERGKESKKKDLSKMQLKEKEVKRLEKKAFNGMSKEKRSEKLREMRAASKRAESKAKDLEKSLKTLEKKHESLNKNKKVKKEEKDHQRVKREAEMKKENQLKKPKLTKGIEQLKINEKKKVLNDKKADKDESKMSAKLDHGKHTKKDKQMKRDEKKTKAGSFLLKHLHEENEGLLKSALPYMKEGRTQEERRALKALRLRVKRDAMAAASEGDEVSSSKTKSKAESSVKAFHKFSQNRAIRDDFEKNKKAAMKGQKKPHKLKKKSLVSEDEVNGNELESGTFENGIPGFEFSTESDDGLVTITALPSGETSEIPANPSTDLLEENGITYEEPSVSRNPEDIEESIAIVTLSPDVEAESLSGAETEYHASNSRDYLSVTDLPDRRDNFIAPFTDRDLENEIQPAMTTPSILDEDYETTTRASTTAADETTTRASTTAADEATILALTEVADETTILTEVADETTTRASTTAAESTPTESPANVPRGPWPWDITEEGAEACGQARFGPETRLNRGRRMLKILEGKEALPGSFPWQVAILDGDRDLRCGGTLIAPRWVMTAAHCTLKKMLVRLSEHHIHDREGYEIEQKVRRVFVHPEYNRSTINNDIALLRLPAPPPIPDDVTGRPTLGITDRACLPRDGEHFPPVGTRCLVMGWGKPAINAGFGTDVLMYTRLPIISKKACQRANRKNITENMFCAGHYKGGSDTCSGDSGGPLLCETDGSENTWTVYGVTSFGDGCGVAGKMGVYARVNNYLDWMAGIMRRYIS